MMRRSADRIEEIALQIFASLRHDRATNASQPSRCSLSAFNRLCAKLEFKSATRCSPPVAVLPAARQPHRRENKSGDRIDLREIASQRAGPRVEIFPQQLRCYLHGLPFASDAGDGAHRAASTRQSLVAQTVDLGRGKAIARGNRRFYDLRFDRPGLYLSPICAIFVSTSKCAL